MGRAPRSAGSNELKRATLGEIVYGPNAVTSTYTLSATEIPGYRNFTLDNFAFTRADANGYGDYHDIYWELTNYDPATGTITIKKTVNNVGSTNRYFGSVTVVCYFVS